VEQRYKGGDANARDGNFGRHQEAWSFSSLQRNPGTLGGQERSGEAGKGWSIFAWLSRQRFGKIQEVFKEGQGIQGCDQGTKQQMQATFQSNLEKAKSAAENAKGAMTAAANKMFMFYANLLSIEAKYV
jgi:hypothetical protein